MAKAKGKEKPTASIVPAEVEEATGDDVTIEPTPPEPVKVEEEETTVNDGSNKSEEAEESEEEEQMEEPEEEEVKEDVIIEAEMTTVTPEGEKMEEGDAKEEAKVENTENTSNKKGKRQWKRKKAACARAAASNAADKPESSDPEKKGLKKAEGMGLIFMCNSKTKKDCFQYKVFGLPESKKDMVTKVYKGMRLFLFDIDNKMMHGIYKAASPGGYNIEPKAFKSAFPSQVRFTVLKDCKPLPEEKFKAAIKANYFGRNKFNTQLNQEQVRDLCKLFMNENKSPKQKRAVNGAGKAPVSAGRRDWTRRPPPRPFQRREPYYPRGLAYPSPVARPVAPHAPLPPPLYAYERPADDYYYRGEPRERMMDVEMRPREPIEYRDPYSLYRDPAPYRDPYREAGYPSSGPYAPPPPLYRY